MINGDIHYDNYEINSEIRPLNLKSKAGYIICYKDNFDFYSIILDKQHLFIHKNTNDKIKLIKKEKFLYNCDNFIKFNIKVQKNLITIKVNNKIKFKDVKIESSNGKFGLISEAPCYFKFIKSLQLINILKSLKKY